MAFTNSLETTKDTVNANVQKLVDTKMDAGVAPGVLSNPANITKSGNYYYNSSTQGLPTLNGSNANGIIQAVMRDENNGMLSILGTGLTRENIKVNYTIDGNLLRQYYYGVVEHQVAILSN